MWIFVGLGNPGPGYSQDRHNVGFMAIEALRQAWAFPVLRDKGNYLWSEGVLGTTKVALCQPMQYMNRSGEALATMINKHRHNHWVVLHDELDLPCGQLRFKQGGGTGGHNGLKSLHRFLGEGYARVRFGIGRPPEKSQVAAYVLSKFSPDQKLHIQDALIHMTACIDLLLAGKAELFMTKLHSAH